MAASVEVVKAAVGSGIISTCTVAALKSLLDPESTQDSHASNKAAMSKASGAGRKAIPAQNGRPVTAKSRKSPAVLVHEDSLSPVSGREKYALATQTVNKCLKLLADSLKSQRSLPSMKLPAVGDTAHSISGTPHQRALQARSGNTTPVRSPQKVGCELGAVSISPHDPLANQSSQITAIAQCAHLGFSFLLNADFPALGVREMPRWQLEAGLLSLVGNLIAYGLVDLALKELRVLKQRLEAASDAVKTGKQSRTNRTISAASGKETLVTLLHLNATFNPDIEGLSVAIAYQQHVIKLISIHGTPTVLESLPQHTAIDAPNGPVDLIMRQAKMTKDFAKAAKQLEALSHTILCLGPSVSSSADSNAVDTKMSPSPEAMLQLQTNALRIRKLWWRLAKHQADVSQELLQPFLKCTLAYARGHQAGGNETDSLRMLESCFESLGPFDSKAAGTALFEIHNILCIQAERAGKEDQALRWAKRMLIDCDALEPSHARRVASIVRNAALENCGSEFERVSTLTSATNVLQSKITGSRADYELLVEAIFGLSKRMSHGRRAASDSLEVSKVLTLAAAFCQRYARSYPGQKQREVLSILSASLRHYQSIDDPLNWISGQSAAIFIQAGTLQAITEKAVSQPLLDAWLASHEAVSLGRIVNTLLLRAIRTNSNSSTTLLYDDEQLGVAQRSVLLEWQLYHAAELATRVRYHEVLKKIFHDLLRRLAKLYTVSDYPIRRARVAALAFGVREKHPDLIPPHILKIWHDGLEVNIAALGEDSALVNYCNDLATLASISRLFSEVRPAVKDFKPHLRTWQQIIYSCKTRQALCNHIDNPSVLIQHLKSIAAYLSMLGDDQTTLPVRQMLVKLDQLVNEPSSETCTSMLELAGTYMDLGYSETAGRILSQAEAALTNSSTSHVANLRYRILSSEYALCVGDVENCSTALEQAGAVHATMTPEALNRQSRKANEIIHAQGWLVHSKLQFENGRPTDALASAKRAVQILNGIWLFIERETGAQRLSTSMEPGAEAESAISGLVKGIRKLQIVPSEGTKRTASEQQIYRGAGFWRIVPVLLKALLHLSDVYTHHGIFDEANYYSERAITIAESVGSTLLLAQVRSHRCHLLALGGRLEEAEMCLAQDESIGNDCANLTKVDLYCARAALRQREGSFDSALMLYEKAERMLDDLNSEKFLAKLESFGDERTGIKEETTIAVAPSSKPVPRITTTASQKLGTGSTMKTKAITSLNTAKSEESSPTENARQLVSPMLDKIKARISIAKTLMALRSGLKCDDMLVSQEDSKTGLPLQRQLVRHYNLAQKAYDLFQTNVTLNLLPESTISFPALTCLDVAQVDVAKRSNPGKVSKKSTRHPAKAKPRSAAPAEVPGDLLLMARDSLLKNHAAQLQRCGTSQTHSIYSSLSSVALLLSSIAGPVSITGLVPSVEAFHIDLPRIKALQLEKASVAVDATKIEDRKPFTWSQNQRAQEGVSFMASEYQINFVDIMPRSWVAVSLCLSEDGSELHVVRYRACTAPFILKVPFARHQPGEDDGIGEHAFDYRRAKAELKEIIDLSNYSCHNPGSVETEGAKSKWWKEREDLDRRLQELLMNIESIWFGGFKAVFAVHSTQDEALERFKTSFEQILARYLPSRSNANEKSEVLVLDQQVLELFVGLGTDSDGTRDLEEPVTDLLYFVVDMLQFKGERNAYDEIDFDSMAIDVLDALRTYHDSLTSDTHSSEHLILVLDRRLQAFPWENLPCLEDASVSRVGSMLSLRDCILAMRKPADTCRIAGLPNNGEGCHVVAANSGTYILNPSSDLPATQAMLGPSLSSLARKPGTEWNSMVNESPSEGYFKSSLATSSVTLYFGHGGGWQYIRPRTIKRLARCSEVVWLMGCSSGTVWENGDLEPNAVALAYLLAGGSTKESVSESDHGLLRQNRCMCVVSTLWDVTDKDIDRFSLAIGEEWGLWPASGRSQLPAKTPRKREIVAQPSTPVQVPKTPKTPKVRKTPAVAKTPVRSRTRFSQDEGRKLSLAEAVARSRDACYLRYLNGAAPVVYGVPVYLGD